MSSGLFAKYLNFPTKRYSIKHMNKTIPVMFYKGKKRQRFLHNFKNIIYKEAKLNVKKVIYVGEKSTCL